MRFIKDLFSNLFILILIFAVLIGGTTWFLTGGYKYFGSRLFNYEDLKNLRQGDPTLPVNSKKEALQFAVKKWDLIAKLDQAKDFQGQPIPANVWTISVDFNDQVFREKVFNSWYRGESITTPRGFFRLKIPPAERRTPEVVAEMTQQINKIPDHWIVKAYISGAEQKISCYFTFTSAGEPLPEGEDPNCGFED